MSGWLTFAGVFVLFFATHSIPVRPPVKKHLVKHLGAKGFTRAYSALSLLILALLIWAAQQAPFVLLWAEGPWHRPVIWLGMLVACLILTVSIGQPNPFSFGGRNNHAFDPLDAGVIGYLRHPLLNVLALWALLHVLANGDLAHVLLFATLALFALAGPRVIDARKKRDLGADAWLALVSETRSQRRFQVPSRGTMLRLCAGVTVYLMLVYLHPIVIGAPVFL
ncbi:NnrU family protein [Roseobacter litoralis]|uniref:NnrU family protein n=1 Tax=Roseobacter litoralis TaxID=42443 RepID=UPI002493464A|nr:NnrU family protein [Roseobacter litoralis]